MYFLVRSDHGERWGLTKIIKNGLLMSSIALDDLEFVFFWVRSDLGDGRERPEIVKNGFQMSPNSFR